ATHALAAQCARGRMLVDEQGGAIECAGTIELPELAQRLRLRWCVLLQCLRVRANRVAVRIHDAHGVGKHVEDGLELGDTACEILTQLFALGDVAAGEENATCALRISERNEVRLDKPSAAAMLERNANRDDRHTTRRDIDLLCEIGERVWKCVV